MRTFYLSVLSGMVDHWRRRAPRRSGRPRRAHTSSIAITLSSPSIGATSQASATATLSSGSRNRSRPGGSPTPSRWRPSPTVASSPAPATAARPSSCCTADARGSRWFESSPLPGAVVRRAAGDVVHRQRRVGEDRVLPGVRRRLTDGFGLGLAQSGESLTASPNYVVVFVALGAVVDCRGWQRQLQRDLHPHVVARHDRHGLAHILAQPRVLAGTVSEVWRLAGVAGEGRLEQDIVQASARPPPARQPSGTLACDESGPCVALR